MTKRQPQAIMDAVAKARTVSEQLREAIRASGRSMLDIAREADLDKATMSRFLNGHRGLRMDVIDTLCKLLGLRLTNRRTTKKRGKR